MLGAEVRDLGELPAPRLRDRIIDLAFHRGLLLLPCGASTVRFCPPLCLTARQVEIGLELLDSAMAAAMDEAGPHNTTETEVAASVLV
jgi:4-aminobutyrate aminotransferase